MAVDADYDLHSLQLPRLAGGRLRTFVRLLENRATRPMLLRRLVRDSGIGRLRGLMVDEVPSFEPYTPVELPAAETDGVAVPPAMLVPALENRTGYAGALDYAAAYWTGATTPEEVAENLLAALADSEAHSPAMRLMIACNRDDVLRQARAAAERWRSGNTLGPFDGVPVAVKDEFDQIPYDTTVGTGFLKGMLTGRDATAVARLRAAGAILFGKANMHELSLGVTGHNLYYEAVRNPYDAAYHTGGSSSGSAALVAAGLAPVTLGTDGGGSIRTPAALCGVVGLKPTHGRISAFGAAFRFCSVACAGPIAATARDAALAYGVIAGPDPEDRKSWQQPPVTLVGFDNLDLSDLILGVYPSWFEHAAASVVEPCKALLKALQERGARVREIKIPELEAGRVAHLVTITAEAANALERHYALHYRQLSPETRISVTLGRFMPALEYVQAQRIRTRLTAHFHQALESVDMIVTPTTARTAPPIAWDSLPEGEVDFSLVGDITRFAFPANLLGLPAISFPAGYDSRGLPVGMQAMGRPWQEHVLLRLANVAEQIVKRRLPPVHYRLLPQS